MVCYFGQPTWISNHEWVRHATSVTQVLPVLLSSDGRPGIHAIISPRDRGARTSEADEPIKQCRGLHCVLCVE